MAAEIESLNPIPSLPPVSRRFRKRHLVSELIAYTKSKKDSDIDIRHIC